MSADEMDVERRRFLTAATTVVGGVGAALAAMPFLGSWLPSEKAKALGAPVEVDVSKIEPGQKITVAWRGQPIFVVHRTPKSIEDLPEQDGQLRDPESLNAIQPSYIHNQYRSIKPEYLVVLGLCTHLGCVPVFKPKIGSLDASWLGGFFCPCHGSKYDMAGRVYKGVPAPTNLPVPPYHFVDDSRLLIGVELDAEAPGELD